jgi:precorrin-2/cobalt-factor-2 C20-methyltransferase
MLTLRAVNLIKSADVIVAYRSCNAEESLALNVIRSLTAGKEVIVEQCHMEHDPRKIIENWIPVTDIVAQRATKGKAVAFITLGDSLLYSSAVYFHAALSRSISLDFIHYVPGITAFQAAGALMNDTLAEQNDSMTLMTFTTIAALESALDISDTIIVYKAARGFQCIVRLLEGKGLLESSYAVSFVETEGKETIISDLKCPLASSLPYMTTLIIHKNMNEWE